MPRTLTTIIGMIGNQIAEMEVSMIQVSLEIQCICQSCIQCRVHGKTHTRHHVPTQTISYYWYFMVWGLLRPAVHIKGSFTSTACTTQGNIPRNAQNQSTSEILLLINLLYSKYIKMNETPTQQQGSLGKQWFLSKCHVN